ncbi:FAD-dependent monooxygenase [Microbacterium deminutum]|uniref:FAD-binding domain-containing protein n=1 Tax=Microbacterium deminutum TaxID=344164 RepID=A0ABN2QHR8_9MICO
MSTPAAPPQPWDIAIVGAGPIGLLLAGELAADGSRVVIFEREDSPSSMPKANGVVGRAARELAQRGILAGTRLRVRTPPRFQFGPLVLNLGFGPGNPLHILPVPQSRLEELLERRATQHGADVRRGHEVIGFAQRDDSVTVDVRTGEVTSVVKARYLVGCDGAHSLVRKQAGIGFPGFTGDEISRIARVTLPADRITRRRDSFEIPGLGSIAAMRPNLLPGGAFSIAPMSVLDRAAPPDLYLVSTHEPRRDDEPSDSVSIDELRASFRRVLGVDLPITGATAIRSTVGNSRQAEAYRRGRVFLAGDAAHVFNAGGSALNVGIQDALELADRLGAALSSEGGTDGLDAYEAIRHPAGHRALQHTRAQAALGRSDDSARALREIMGGLVASRRAARSLARLIEDG